MSDDAASLGEIWRGRSVFLTGHTGFKGGWLAALLHRLGARATGYALAPEPGESLFEAARIGELTHSIIADVRDGERLRAEMQAAAPEVVFHLAAQALVRRARSEPDLTFDTNVMGTVRLLEAVRATPSVKAVVVVTSDKVYDNREWPWRYRESDALGGKEPYGASKAACEMVLQSYRHAYFGGDSGVAVASARAGNVIGGGDWAQDRLVPDAIRAFSAGAPLVIRNPSAVRPWQHVLEPLLGYLTLARALLAKSPGLADIAAFNFGPAAGDACPVSDVAGRLAALWGQGARWQRDPSVHPYEAHLLEVDSSLACSVLGWSPEWGLAEGVEHTIDWYRRTASGEEARAVTLSQIDERLNG